MKKSLTTLFVLTGLFVSAQELKWKVSMETQKVFIENLSQFSGRDQVKQQEVLFATEDGPVQILFTKIGLTYRFEKRERKKVDENELKATGMTHEEMEKLEHETEITTDVVTMEWKNVNPDVEVVGLNPVHHYYNYKGTDGSIKANAFEKIIYRNLYPDIDVEYVFHPETGIEYTFVLHPGADVSQIAMQYSDVSKIYLDADKNLHLPTLFGDIIDHTPYSYYADGKGEISSGFVLKGKTVNFQLQAYNTKSEVIIDPWTVTPAMGNANRVFHIESDSSGNAYIYGGDSPFKLQKYNASGALQWTYTNGWDSSTYWFGGLITDRVGNSFITAGTAPEITKVNAAGGQVWSNTGGIFDEYWSLAFNCDETQLIVGGTRLTGIPFPNGSGRAFTIDLTNGAVLNSVKVANFVPSFIFNDPNEIRSICASPNGNYYFITLDTIGSLTPALGINWRSVSGYRFGYGSPNYGFTPQGQSIIRASITNLYTMNGDSIVMRDINTGVVTGAAAIPGGGHTTTPIIPGTSPKNGGIAIDACGNIFVGSQSNVTVFDASLGFIASVNTPSAVYDVAIGKNGDILSCGNGFATAITYTNCGQIPSNCNTITVNAALESSDTLFCNKGCIDFFDLSTNNPTSWQWSFPGGSPNSSTLQNPVSICYNSFSSFDVQLIACNATGCDTLFLPSFISVFQPPSPPVITVNYDTLTSSPAVTYQWYLIPSLIPGATSQSYVTTVNGTYFVVIADSNGCLANSDTLAIFTGLPALENDNTFHVFPNPATDNITVTYPAQVAGKIEIGLFEITGRRLFNAVYDHHGLLTHINTKGLAGGVYFLELKINDVGKVYKVLIKNR